MKVLIDERLKDNTNRRLYNFMIENSLITESKFISSIVHSLFTNIL